VGTRNDVDDAYIDAHALKPALDSERRLHYSERMGGATVACPRRPNPSPQAGAVEVRAVFHTEETAHGLARHALLKKPLPRFGEEGHEEMFRSLETG
jgi:hypothetical protein